jgi:hypothetical protein
MYQVPSTDRIETGPKKDVVLSDFKRQIITLATSVGPFSLVSANTVQCIHIRCSGTTNNNKNNKL